jgi:hypothetical protein
MMNMDLNKLRLIGRREFVNFPQLGLIHVEAKVDTGAYTSSLHCEEISIIELEGIPTLNFTLINPDTQEKKGYNFTTFATKKIRNSFGEMEERYLIKTPLKIGRKTILVNISLSNRDKMRYPVLIGRRPLKGKFLIDVKQLHTGGSRLQKKPRSGL